MWLVDADAEALLECSRCCGVTGECGVEFATACRAGLSALGRSANSAGKLQDDITRGAHTKRSCFGTSLLMSLEFELDSCPVLDEEDEGAAELDAMEDAVELELQSRLELE